MGACGVGIGTVMRSRGAVSRAPIGSSGHRGGTTEQNGWTERGWTGQDRTGQDRTGQDRIGRDREGRMKRDGVMGVYSARWMEGMNTDGAQVEARESRLETMPLDRSAPQVGTTRRAITTK